MQQSESIVALAAALVTAQGEMKNAPLNKINPHFKSKYADLPGIRDAVIPVLTKHGLGVTQLLDTLGDELVVNTVLIHKSGEYLGSTYPIGAEKNTPQGRGSAITYARRYALAAICGIAADEDDDANAAEKEGRGNGKAPAPSPADKKAVEIRDALRFAKTEDELAGIWKTSQDHIRAMDPDLKQSLEALKNERKIALTTTPLDAG